MLEHDLINDALAALRETAALDRDNVQIKRQLAGALEKAKGYAEAERLWLEIGERAKKSNDRILARDVRAHLVTVWSLERRLENQVAALGIGSTLSLRTSRPAASSPSAAPPSPHGRRRSNPARLVTLAPGDVDGLRALRTSSVRPRSSTRRSESPARSSSPPIPRPRARPTGAARPARRRRSATTTP
ncbi:MAG: hypothetical protein U0235_08860 [Polyangiaceae bacterium]